VTTAADRPLVLVVVGTDHHPFARLVNWVDGWLATVDGSVECVVQYGTATPPERASGVAYLDHDELGRLIERAAAVITHGGPGTIIDCRRRGRLPIAVPRRHDFGEHVDDHQVHFVRRLAQDGIVATAESSDDLARLLDAGLREPGTLAVTADDAGRASVAVDRFGAFVAELCAEGPPSRRPRRARRRD
jgi:UDP-N-acetylglucosamine transferase subunit ALG13